MPGHPQTWDRIENCSNVQEIVALSVVATDHSLLSSVVAAAFATGAEPIDGYECARNAAHAYDSGDTIPRCPRRHVAS